MPMDSFFQKDPGGKRHVISRRDGQPFGVAGTWENWRDPLTDKWERTFAVVTVPANELVVQIHDRMLAILPNDLFARWLSDEADPRELLVRFPQTSLPFRHKDRDASQRPVRTHPHSVDSRRVEPLDDYPMRRVFAASRELPCWAMRSLALSKERSSRSIAGPGGTKRPFVHR